MSGRPLELRGARHVRHDFSEPNHPHPRGAGPPARPARHGAGREQTGAPVPAAWAGAEPLGGRRTSRPPASAGRGTARVPLPGLRRRCDGGPAAAAGASTRRPFGTRRGARPDRAGQLTPFPLGRLENTQARIATKRMTVTTRFATVSTSTSTPRLGEPVACRSHREPLVTPSPTAKTISPRSWWPSAPCRPRTPKVSRRLTAVLATAVSSSASRLALNADPEPRSSRKSAAYATVDATPTRVNIASC